MMNLKSKICKCGEKALKNRRICYSCFLKREREKRKLKIAKLKERKKIKRKKDHNSYKYLHKVAWTLFSKSVRMEGADENGMTYCYTCGKRFHWKELQAGHFHHGRLDFDRRNIKKQCPRCNKWLSGNLAIYGTKLSEELGKKGMNQLILNANTKTYSTTELKQIIKELKNETKNNSNT